MRPKVLSYQRRVYALAACSLASYFLLPVNGSSKFNVNSSLIASSFNWFSIYLSITFSCFPTVLT